MFLKVSIDDLAGITHLMGMIPFLAKIFDFLLQPKKGEVAPGAGRAIESASIFDGTNPDSITERNEGLSYFWAMGENPYIAAGLQYRNIGRLWKRARCADKENDDPLSDDHQLIGASEEPIDKAVWEFCAWNMDERLNKKGMYQLIKQAQFSCIQFGRSVQELVWSVPPEKTPYGKKTVLLDVLDRDPERFVINPPNLAPGVYLKPSIYTQVVSAKDRMPDRKFVVFSANPRFENLYGTSALNALVKADFSINKIGTFWDRDLEKHGSAQLLHKYPKSLSGDAHKATRDTYLESIRKAQHQSVIQICEDHELTALLASGEHEGFKARLTMLISEISLILTGSPTALLDTQVGAYSKEESGTVRSRSYLEHDDIQVIQDGWNFQILPWLCDWNWTGLTKYPRLQLVAPEEIAPTTPKDQPDAQQPEQMPMSPNNGKPPTMPPKPGQKPGASLPVKEQPQKIEVQTGPKTKNFAQASVLHFEELPPAEDVRAAGFPSPEDPPAEYVHPRVLKKASQFAAKQPVLTRKEFDKLPDKGKLTAFTVSGIDNREALLALQAKIQEGLRQPNEKTAWLAYKPAAMQILKDYGVKGFNVDDLAVSFRMGRQNAFVQGIMSYAKSLDSHKQLHGLQYHTKDDAAVRWNHQAMNDVIQPIDSEFWKVWMPLNGFNCRCYPSIVTTEQFRADPEKWKYTDYDKAIKPDKGFYR